MWIFSFLLPTFLFFRQNKLNFHRLFSLEVGPLKCYAILVIHISLDTRRNNAVMKSQNNASISYAATPRPAEFARLFTLPIDRIISNASAPREFFDEESLARLADSISKHGILQPVTVRRVKTAAPRSATDGTKVSGTVSEVAFLCGVSKFELVCGERRLRATQMAGLKEIPAIVVQADDEESAVLALIENIQRENLSYMEEALGYLKLAREYHMTQEEIAKLMGKTQSAVANKLRILKLCGETKRILAEYGLTERHAQALLRLSNEEQQIKAAKMIVVKRMNVREAEEYIESLLQDPKGKQLERLPLCGADKSVRLREGANRPKVKRFIRDIRLFTNTVNRAALYMKEAGVPVQVAENKNEGYYEMVIRVPYQTGGA